MKLTRLLKSLLIILAATSLSASALASDGPELNLDEALGQFKESRESQTEEGGSTLLDELLEGALAESDIDLTMLTDEGAKSAKEALESAVDENGLKSDLEIDSRVISAALIFDSHADLRKAVENLVRDLHKPGDHEDVKVVFNASYFPTVDAKVVDEVKEVTDRIEELREKRLASMGEYYRHYFGRTAIDSDPEISELKEKLRKIIKANGGTLPEAREVLRIRISAGTLAFVKNYDELAAVVAQALSRLNPRVFSATQNKKVREALTRVAGYKDLHEDEQKLIQADLAAVERLTRSGFNPWALHRFERRTLDKMEDGILSRKWRYALNKFMLSRSLEDAKDDPIRPLRHTAMESWIGLLTETEKIEKTNKPLPKELKKLRNRLSAYIKPYYSLLGTLSYSTGGALLISGGQPILWALGALGVSPAVLTPIAAAAGGVLAEVAMGTFGAVTGSVLLYGGWKNRKNLKGAVKNSVKRIGLRGVRTVLGTAVAGGQLIRATGTGAKALIGYAGSGVTQGIQLSRNVAIYTSQNLIIAPAKGAYKQVAYIADTGQTMVKARSQRSKVLQLTDQYAKADSNKLATLGQTLATVQNDLRTVHNVLEDFRAYKQELRDEGWIARQYSKTQHKPLLVVRAATTRSFYIHLLEEFATILENQEVEDDDLQAFFDEYDSTFLPLDLADSGNFQSVVVRISKALYRRGKEHFILGPSEGSTTLPVTSSDKGMRFSEFSNLFYQLNEAMENNEMLDVIRFSKLLSQRGLSHTQARLVKEFRHESLKFAISNYRELSEEQRKQLIEFSNAFTHFNGQIVLTREFYKSISDEDVILLMSLAETLGVSIGSRLKKLARKAIEQIITDKGNQKQARDYIRILVSNGGGIMDPLTPYLFGDGESLKINSIEETIEYLNYLIEKNKSNLLARSVDKSRRVSIEDVEFIYQRFTEEARAGNLTQEHLTKLAESNILLRLTQEELDSGSLKTKSSELYDALLESGKATLADDASENKLIFNPVNYARHVNTLNKFSMSDPASSMKSKDFYDALLFMTRNFDQTHTLLSDWITGRIPALLKGAIGGAVHPVLGSNYLYMMFSWTRMGIGRGFSFFNMSQEKQGINILSMLSRGELRGSLGTLNINTQARILAHLIPLNFKGDGVVEKNFLYDHYWKKHGNIIKTFFNGHFPDSRRLNKVIDAFIAQFAEEHKSLEKFLFETRRLFPITVRNNSLVTRLLQRVSVTNFTVSSENIFTRVVDTYGLNLPSGVNKNYYLEHAGNAFLEILAYTTQVLLNKGSNGQKIQKKLDDVLSIPGLRERLYVNVMDRFPSNRLTELSIAIEKSGTWDYVDYLSQNPEDIHRQGFKLDYFAHLSRSLESIESNFNADLLLKIIDHILYVGQQNDKNKATLNGINTRAHTILIRLFRKYGSDLASHVISKEADPKQRMILFNLLNHFSKTRINYESHTKLNAPEGGSVVIPRNGANGTDLRVYTRKKGDPWGGIRNEILASLDSVKNPGRKFLGIEFGAEYLFPSDKELWKTMTRNLNRKQKLAWRTISRMYNYRDRFSLVERLFTLGNASKTWINSVNSMVELDQLINNEVASLGTDMQAFASRLHDMIKGRPHLITSLDDAKAMLSNDAFWPEMTLNTQHVSLLERPFVRIIENRLKDENTNKGSWKYPPAFSEAAHGFIIEQLRSDNQMPKDFESLFDLWIQLTNRGVTSHSDQILNQLLDMANAEQTAELEDFAIIEQRIFETTARDEMIVQRIQNMDEYQGLTNGTTMLSEEERMEQLKEIVSQLQVMMPERGLRYEQFLEDLSVNIMSSQAESQYLHQQKGLGDNSDVETSDNNVTALHKVIKQLASWKPHEQFDFILFLRGDIEATTFLKRKFPNIGPERVRRMYEILPVEYRVGVLDFILGQTFFKYSEELDVSKGYPRKLIEQGVTGGRKEKDPKKVQAQEVTRQILLAGLVGIKDGSGDAEFQKLILANILAVPQGDEGSVGQTLKLVLEKGFGPLGVKIGQLIVAMNILDKEDARALLDVQDNARPLQREQQFQEFRDIVGSTNLPFTMKELLGSASIKWAIEGRMNNSQQRVAIKVFREEVEVMLHNRYKVLEAMVEYLVKNVGPEYRILKAIIDSAKRAVEKELDGAAEERQSKIARDRIYINLDDNESTVKVPREAFESGRIIISEFVEGMSFHRLPESIKHIAAAKILGMERDILFADGDEITFDPDRHGGNYRIHLPSYDGERHVVLEPIQYGVIDFGQLITIDSSIRTNLVEIFAISQIISESGTNEWLTEKLGQVFNLEGDKLVELGRVLRSYFPNPKLKEQTAYFATLSALHEVGVDLNPGYFDFARAVMQLMQYEPYVPENFETPSRLLQKQIVERIAVHLRELAQERPTAVMARNMWNWTQSKFSNKTYRPITTQIDADTVLGFKFDGSVWQEEKAPGRTVVPAVFGFTCEAQFR